MTSVDKGLVRDLGYPEHESRNTFLYLGRVGACAITVGAPIEAPNA